MSITNISNEKNIKLIVKKNYKSDNDKTTKCSGPSGKIIQFIKYISSGKTRYINLFVSKYYLLHARVGGIKKHSIDEFRKIAQKIYTYPLLYNPISSAFIPDYAFCIDNDKYLIDRKKILILGYGINNDEALLYYYTQKNKFNDVTYHIYPIFFNNLPSEDIFKKYSQMLLKYYSGENIAYHDTRDNPIMCNNYENIIDLFKDAELDLIIFDFRLFQSERIDNFFLDIYHFSSVLITLNILQKGGHYIFRLKDYSEVYVLQIITFLSKYFTKIFIYNDKIRVPKYYRVCCIDYVGKIDKSDIEILNSVMIRWNKLNPECGSKNIPKEIITNLFSFENENPDLKKKLDLFQIKANKSIDKLIQIYETKLKDIKNLSVDEMLQYHLYNNEVNLKRSIYMAKLYNLKLKPDILAKAKSLPKQIQLLELFIVPINIFILVTNKNNINDNIGINKNLITDINPLISIKEKLNLYKIGIDSRNTKKWEQVTRNLNISQGIIQNINNNYHIDVSRGFCKMYEIYTTFNLVKKSQTELCTLHICEAPGHFINATNYYLKTFWPEIKHRWDANSLNPTHNNSSGIGDVYGIIKNYPDRWHWGYDKSGDITKKSTIDYFYDKKNGFAESIDIFTSDCGIGAETRSDYYNQENQIAQINCSQILIALITTRIKGSAVFKLFVPVTKPITISLIYLLSNFFTDVSIFKPTTSSGTNNEIYIIAMDKKVHLDINSYNLISNFIINNFDAETYLVKSIDSNFIDQLAHISNKITDLQIENLRVIYAIYDKPYSITNDELAKIKYEYYLKWCKYFKFDNVDKNNFLKYVKK